VLLHLDALRADVVRDRPFRWGRVEALLDADGAARLRAAFPTDGFFPNEGHDGEKGYRHHMRPLLTQGASAVAAEGPQDDVWQELVAELTGPPFRRAMGAMLGEDVAGCGIEASLFRYEPGDFLGAHRDLPAKLASLIVYLSDGGFDRSTGGCLRILRSGDEDDVEADVEPAPGSAALIVRSNRSWHAVSRIDDAAPGARIGFQVVLWRPDERSTNWTVDDATGAVSAGRRVYNGSWWRRARARWRDRAPT
jgi:hypothetical protein